MMYDRQDLKRFQSESLEEKIQRSYAKISEWYSNFNGEVYVSFSGGKDSTVLADMCAQWCQITGRTLNMLYIDTGLEYPEVRSHAKQFSKWLEQKYGIQVVLDIKRPSMRFDEVIKKYGYPVISKEVSECVYEGRRCLESNGKKYCYRLNKLLGTAVDKDGKTSIFNQKKYEPLLYTDFVIGSKCCTVMKKIQHMNTASKQE